MVSMPTSEPRPAGQHHAHDALALTVGPRVIHTSHGKLPASLVSLAGSGACRPSLLMMVGWIGSCGLRFLVERRRDSDFAMHCVPPDKARATSISKDS